MHVYSAGQVGWCVGVFYVVVCVCLVRAQVRMCVRMSKQSGQFLFGQDFLSPMNWSQWASLRTGCVWSLANDSTGIKFHFFPLLLNML